MTSCGRMSNCFEPHGHNVSTTSKIRLLCGIFCTLNGRSQPDEWQLVSFPLSGVLVFRRSGCSTNWSVFRSHSRVNDESGVTLLTVGGAGVRVGLGTGATISCSFCIESGKKLCDIFFVSKNRHSRLIAFKKRPGGHLRYFRSSE